MKRLFASLCGALILSACAAPEVVRDGPSETSYPSCASSVICSGPIAGIGGF